MLTYQFPNLKAWEQHVKTLTTLDELHGAVATIYRARSTAGIHPFYQNETANLALWFVDERAKSLKFSKLNSGHSYYQSPTP